MAAVRALPAAAAALALGAGSAAAEPAPATAPEVTLAAAPPRHAVWVALPSLDGLAGLEVGAERRLADRLGAAASVAVRRSAAGDYDGLAIGVAGELRWYWRGRARWSHVPGLDRQGWFVGGRVDLGRSRLTHDGRSLGSMTEAAAAGELGYRLTPWRRLEVTALVAAGARVVHDQTGRLPTWTRGSLGVGLDVGWLF